MPTRRLVLSILVLAAMGALLVGQQRERSSAAAEMAARAQGFLEALSEEQREAATFAFDDAERLNWHFIPRERKGVPLKDLKRASREAALTLVASGLSQSGYEQATNVRSLEEVLFLLEGGEMQQRRERRDPENYYVSIFGEPGPNGKWGWRFEGHHLSLNYTIEDGRIVSSTPEFFGANPAFIDAGPEREIRVLGPEEMLARQVLKLANEDQRRRIVIDDEAPDDIRAGGEAQPPVTEPVGLAASGMSEDQRQALRALLGEYLQNMPQEVQRERRQRINEAGVEKIHFAWWGSDQLNERHAYRVQGPTFLIEYNNTQNNANHLHTVWRDLAGDFDVPVKAAE